ncbi:MAG: BamA/TamA family outer membrane protein [candidate division Zixibacteria bacterium]|nr:BamA/TamA family outer membrane protein [candidate division Zixibacteria bacterium]
MRRMMLTILICAVLTASSIYAQADTVSLLGIDIFDSNIGKKHISDFSGGKPKIALALSGGGARGIAQIGIIKVLENEGIDFDLICGTSMGGLIGGFYAAGISIDSIENIARNLDWVDFFSNRPQRSTQFITQKESGENSIITLRFRGTEIYIPSGVTTGQKLNSFLTYVTSRLDYIYDNSFDSLPIPLRICAVDLVSGNLMVFDGGSLGNALRATTSFPLAFEPFEMDSMLLVDGGLLQPIPVETALEEKSDFVIAVNTTSDILAFEDINDPLDIINTTTTIMQLELKEKELELADIEIRPELGNIEATDFTRVDDLIKAGEKAALKALPEIRRKLSELREKQKHDSIKVDSLKLMASPFLIETESFISEDGEDELIVSTQGAREHLTSAAQSGILSNAEIYITNSEKRILHISAQPTFRLDKLTINGTDLFTDNSLLQAAGLEYDDYITFTNLNNLREAAFEFLNSAGYDLAFVEITRDANAPGTLVADVNEGRISGFRISGNNRTRSWVIKRNFLLKEGEPYSIARADSGLANIYGSGLFTEVRLNLEHQENGILVHIRVKEKFSGFLRLGLHYDEYYRTETFLDIGNSNLFGFGQEAFLSVLYGEFRQDFSLNFRADRIYETWYNYLLKIYHNRLEREIYRDNQSLGKREERRSGFEFTLGNQLSGLGNLGLSFGISRIRIEHTDQRVNHTGITHLALSSRVDTRDRSVFTTSGSRFHIRLEFAFDLLWGEENYQKGVIDWIGFYPVTNFMHLIPALSLSISANPLPPSEKFYMGGSRTLYGYREFELEGDKLFNGNLGVRFKLPYHFYISSRFDLGNVWVNWDEVRIDDLLHGYGLMISYDSYLGPLSISYGRNNYGHDRYYLNLGYDF